MWIYVYRERDRQTDRWTERARFSPQLTAFAQTWRCSLRQTARTQSRTEVDGGKIITHRVCQ